VGKPIVGNDGVAVAKEVQLRDPEENLGAQMMREAAGRTGDAVGEGITMATILAHSIFSEGVRNIAAARARLF
jgi:chaperonin GroEL